MAICRTRPVRATSLALTPLTLITVAACGGSDGTTSPTPPTTPVPTVGKQVHRLTSGGQTREFIVYLPPTFQNASGLAVVFVVHGTSQDGEKFYRDSHWREKADAEGFVAVFPTALSHCYAEDENRDGDFSDPGERRVTTKWAAGQLGDPARMPLCTAAELAQLTPANRALSDHPLADDVAFFDAMIAFLDAHYSIDRKRIYATGFSNGAQFASRLAQERSTTYAAAAAQAGGLVVTPAPAARPMSFVFSLGTKDDGYAAALGVPEIPIRQSTLDDFPELRIGLVDKYLTTLRLTSQSTYTEFMTGNRKVGRWVFSTSTAGASNSLTITLFEGLFHQYPDGSNYPLALADPLWDLFKTRTLP
jgi:polyhydroxybutyrate depolymerase